VVIVDGRGVLLADSAGSGLGGASYASRPEIAEALTGRTSQGTRHSDSLDQDLLYTAVPILDEGRRAGAVRITQSVEAVHDETRKDALALIALAAGGLLLGLVVAWLLARSLARPLDALAGTARRIGGGDLDARADEQGSREQREVAREFNEMTDRLARVLDAQREFVGNASHQLRTPLTGLRLRLESAAGKAAGTNAERDIRAAEREADRLEKLLAELLTLAREAESPGRGERVELGAAAEAAYERWREAARQSGHELALHGNGPVTVVSSAQDVAMLLDNLVENAVRYSPEGGRVEIGWGRRDGDAFVAVSDQGPGLGSGEETRVFERFYRGSAAAGSKGTGLGLAIVDALARRWGGSARISNSDTGGARAEVLLPEAER
jgi:signal transduction histidine kinase